jgi:hypothetical protein
LASAFFTVGRSSVILGGAGRLGTVCGSMGKVVKEEPSPVAVSVLVAGGADAALGSGGVPVAPWRAAKTPASIRGAVLAAVIAG